MDIKQKAEQLVALVEALNATTATCDDGKDAVTALMYQAARELAWLIKSSECSVDDAEELADIFVGQVHRLSEDPFPGVPVLDRSMN